jgi:hypothetical protein
VYRSRLHILAGFLLWAVFAYYWYIVARRPITEHTEVALLSVGSIIFVINVIMVVWVVHNLRLAQRNRRLVRAPEPEVPDADFLGRTFIAQDEAELRRANYIEVHLIEMSDEESQTAHKVFRVGRVKPR